MRGGKQKGPCGAQRPHGPSVALSRSCLPEQGQCAVSRRHTPPSAAKFFVFSISNLTHSLTWTHPDGCGNPATVIPAAYEVKLKRDGPALGRPAWRSAGQARRRAESTRRR